MVNKVTELRRKSVAVLLLMIASFVIVANDTIPERPRFSVHIGMSTTMSKVRIVNDYCWSETDEWVTLGFRFQMPVRKVKNLYFETGLSLVTKGFSAENDDMSFDAEPGYIEVPALLSYHLPVKKGFAFKFNGGVYGACGVIGDLVRSRRPVEVEQRCFGPLKRFDYGVVCGIGFRGKWATLDVNLEQGLPQCGGSSQYRFKNRSLVATIGIYLNSPK